MMTGCDLSAITKPWEVQSKVGTFQTVLHLLAVLLPICYMIIKKNIYYLLSLDRYLTICTQLSFQKTTFIYLSLRA